MSEPTIVAAALKLDNVIISLPKPCRHCHILCNLFEIFPNYKSLDQEQGFITNEGNFVDRYEAAKIAKITYRDYLLSEDLW